MTGWLTWLLIFMAAVWLIAVVYWQLVIAEGAYLGQKIVTWLYDLAAERYDGIKQFGNGMEEAFLGVPLATDLETTPGALVLDVATGTGRLPATLLEQPMFQGKVVGLDHSKPMLRVAARKLEKHRNQVTLIWRDAIELPFPGDCFDAVCCLEMLEFTPSPEAQLQEVVRVLRPGGTLLTTRRRGLNARLMPGKTHTVAEFEALLEYLNITSIDIQPWQVEYDLVWGIKQGESDRAAGLVWDVLTCPICDTIGRWRIEAAHIICEQCGREYEADGGIYDMIGPDR